MHNFRYLLVLLIFVSQTGYGQRLEGANWLFGVSGLTGSNRNNPGTHLDFKVPGPGATPYLFDYTGEGGVSSISDKNGQLLFFSHYGKVASRQKVNNRYQLMPNGSLFNSPKGSMSELIVQDPADEQVYYIFLTTYEGYVNTIEKYNLYVAKVDMRLNNGFGDVVPNSMQQIKRNINQNVSALLHANNRDTWIMTQNSIGDSVFSYLVSPSGISAPVTTRPPMYLESLTSIKSSPDSEMLVSTSVAPRTGIGKTEVFRFNRAAGTIAHLYSLTVPKSYHSGRCYSFSPNGSKLYVGTHTPSNIMQAAIYQFDLASGNAVQIQQTATLLYYHPTQWLISDLQLGIDGKLYVALVDTSSFVSRINYPDQAGSACGFRLKEVKVPANASFFPSLNQTIYRNTHKFQAQPARDTICQGQSVQLSAYGAGLDRFRWKPANGLTAPADTLANPVVSPTVTTRYYVTGSNPFRSDTASFKVVVIPKAAVKVSGLTVVSGQMQPVWYKVDNPLRLPLVWNVSGGAFTATLPDSVQVKWNSGATHARVWTTVSSPAGCPGQTDTLQVTVQAAPQPKFYNIITANNDNRNDAFFIGNLEHYPDNELQLFNRWGVEIYRQTNYRNTWKAEKQPGGVYYYYFKAYGQSWKGWVEVMR